MSTQHESEVPGSLSTLWRSLAFAYRAEPRLLIAAVATTLLKAVPDALFALWLKFLVDGIADRSRTVVTWAALGLAFSVIAAWLMQAIGDRWSRRFQLRLGLALQSHVARLEATVPTLEHQERPEYVDRLSVLRNQTFMLDHMYTALISAGDAVIRLGITLVLLATVSPLLLLLAVFAAPTVLVSGWRSKLLVQAEEAGAPNLRRARHFFTLTTEDGPAKEIRLADGLVQNLAARRIQAWQDWHQPIARTQWRTAAWQTIAWGIFGAAVVGALVVAVTATDASAGSVIMVIAAASRLSQYVGMTAGETDFLRFCLDASRRLAWLEDFVRDRRARGRHVAPEQLSSGIKIEGVSFSYPGKDAFALRDVTVDLPAGAVVALVGENGAGKSTLIKLLARFYEPTTGSITVDGTDLADISPDEWRLRLSGAYQDFFTFEFTAQRAIGVGDLPHLDDRAAVTRAAERAGANSVLGSLPNGADTQLGTTWPDGIDVSFGQWQKLAVARGLMRPSPLLLVLDEPTAALDAESEHALFERFAAEASEQAAKGAITLFVSHRFSTVRAADLIIVLSGSEVVEVGSHDELLARDGLYAELYGIQANAYRA